MILYETSPALCLNSSRSSCSGFSSITYSLPLSTDCWPREDPVTHYLLLIGACAQALLVLFMAGMATSCVVSIIRDRLSKRHGGSIAV